MLIDKKREEMYFNCRMRKKKLDKNLAIVRAILIVPPVLLFISTAVDIIMSMLGDAAVLATGAGLYGYEIVGTSAIYLLDLIICAGLAALAACLTIFRTEYVLQRGVWIYVGAAVILMILLLTLDYPILLIYLLLAIIGIPVSIFNKKLIEEDVRMSTLDGYPHFDSSLIKHTDVPFVPASQEELDNMTPDERIMYERTH